MMTLQIRELTYVMVASSSIATPHLISILMSSSGRFLVCRECHLRLEFPFGAHYDIIAKHFESHLCPSLLTSTHDRLSERTVQTLPPTPEALNRFDFDHNATPMWVFDISTLAFSAVNDAAVSHYGYSRKEFLSMTVLDIRPSEDVVPLLREILHKGVLSSAKELRKHKKKDGSLIEVEVTRCEVLFNGCVTDFVSSVDVSAQSPVSSAPHGANTPDAA
jgi:PAS domain S-box-containing protein